MPSPESPPAATDAYACRRLYLVRHGETLYGGQVEGALPGSDLTEQGYRQIEALGQLLAPIEIDAIYTSPLGRAQATARTLARLNGAAITVVEELREITPGDLAGLEMAHIFAAIRAFFGNPDTDWDTPYLGGETYRVLRARVWPFFESLAQRKDWRRVVVVAHGGVNNSVIGEIVGARDSRLANMEQDFGCVNIVDFVGDKPILRLVNFTAYDPLKTGMEASSLEILKAVLEAGLGVSLDDPGAQGA